MHVTLKYVTVATELAGNISGEAHACMPAAEYRGAHTIVHEGSTGVRTGGGHGGHGPPLFIISP